MERQKTRAFLLRLCPSLRDEAVLLAKSEGISLNHFISIALAERMVRLETSQAAARERKALLLSPNRPGSFVSRSTSGVSRFPQNGQHSRSA